MWSGGRPELGQLIDAINDRAILRLDHRGRIITWNRAAPAILAHPIRHLAAGHLSLLFANDPSGRKMAARALEVAASTGRYEFEGWHARGDGSRFWAEVIIAPLTGRHGQALEHLAAIRDLTQQKRQEDGLRAALTVSRAILTGLDEEATFGMIADCARTLVNADLALVRMVDASGTELALRGISARRDGPRLATHPPPAELPIGGSISGLVFESARPRLISEPSTVPERRAGVERADVREEILGSTLLVPLRARKGTMGVLTASNYPSGAALERHDLQTMTVFADQVGLALEEAPQRGYRERLIVIEERRRLARDIHDGVIQSLYAVSLGLAVAAEQAPDVLLHEELASTTAHIEAVIEHLRGLVRKLSSGAPEGSDQAPECTDPHRTQG
jgi:PAS domain S-box-containing protein